MDTVRHCHIDFDTPPVQAGAAPQIQFNDNEKEKLTFELQNLHEAGVIEVCEHEKGEFISHIFPRIKKDGSVRIILNLKNLNETVTYEHFKMDTRQMAARLLTKNCFMASVDLKQAYFAISIAKEHRKYLKNFWEGTLYQFTCMPNGLACGPRIFTKLLKPVFATLQAEGYSCLGYLDDSFLTADTAEECRAGVERMIELFTELGFIINIDKSVLKPTQQLTFLGYIFDSRSMEIRIGSDKINTMKDACEELLHKDRISIREVARVVGLMVAYSEGADFGRLHYRHLERDKIEALKQNYGDFDRNMTISKDGWENILWWAKNAHSQSKKIWRGNPTVVITSDSSLFAWGAIYNSISTGGDWSLEEKTFHINVLEIKAALYALQTFCKDMHNTHIQLKVDNTTAMAYINHMGGSKSKQCDAIAIEMWNWCIERDLWISACHIPGSVNEADLESRLCHDQMEWKLDPQVFNKIVKLWGTPQIDLFASILNNQIPRYVAWKPDPSAEHIDAFSMSWENDLLYAFPPFSLIDRCLQKIHQERATVIMVVPQWPTRPWWAKLNRLLCQEPRLIKHAPDKLRHPVTGQTHPMRKLRLMACKLSGANFTREKFPIVQYL